jgi:hypothetical protein
MISSIDRRAALRASTAEGFVLPPVREAPIMDTYLSHLREGARHLSDPDGRARTHGMLVHRLRFSDAVAIVEPPYAFLT